MDPMSVENREVVRRFLATAGIGYIRTDGAYGVVDANAEAIELLDTDGTLVGTDLRRLGPSFDPELQSAVETAARTGRVVEEEARLDDGSRLLFRSVPADDGVEVLVRDATSDVEFRHELQRANRILETLRDGVYTLDEAFVITSVNEAVTEMTGYDRDEIVGSHASMLAENETLQKADQILDMLRGEGSDVGVIESSITTDEGDSLPIETRFSTVEFADGRREHVGAVRDVTDRLETEHRLQELTLSVRDLLLADDPEAVFETVVDAVTSAWTGTTAVAYAFDHTASRLVPLTASDDDRDACGPGTPAWEAFTSGAGGPEPTIQSAPSDDPSGDDERSLPSARTGAESASPDSKEAEEDPANGRSIRPTGRVVEPSTEHADRAVRYVTLNEHGLVRIEFGPGEVTDNAEELLNLLAANAVAALERVTRESELERHREALAERNEELERLHELNDVLRRVNGALVDAETVSEVANAVCETLIEADAVAFVWLGESYRSGAGATPVASAGESDGYLDELLDTAGDGQQSAGDGQQSEGDGPGLDREGDREPSHRSLRDGEMVRIPDVSDGLGDARWRRRALRRGYRSVVSVPVSYDGLQYGVLSVYADGRSTFDGEFGDLLGVLGETVGDAINGIETRRSLRGEPLVELTLDVEATPPDGGVLPRIAAAVGGRLHVDGTVPQGDDRSLVYFTADEDPAGVAASVHAVESIDAVEEEGNGRVEAVVAGDTVADRVVAHGGSVRRLVVEADRFEVTATFPRSADVRRIVEHLEERYGPVELRARRERTDEPERDATDAVSEELTDRQREAVRTAYLGGYFEWPRGSTGEEVATAMGITQPTFNRHLRTAERKLFGAFLGDDD